MPCHASRIVATVWSSKKLRKSRIISYVREDSSSLSVDATYFEQRNNTAERGDDDKDNSNDSNHTRKSSMRESIRGSERVKRAV